MKTLDIVSAKKLSNGYYSIINYGDKRLEYQKDEIVQAYEYGYAGKYRVSRVYYNSKDNESSIIVEFLAEPSAIGNYRLCEVDEYGICGDNCLYEDFNSLEDAQNRLDEWIQDDFESHNQTFYEIKLDGETVVEAASF